MSDVAFLERRGPLLGLLGALLMFAGDQGLYFAPVSGAEFVSSLSDIVIAAPTDRVLWGASVAPLAAFLYLVGFVALSLRLRPSHPVPARVILVGFGLFMCAGAAFHALWGFHALVLQASAHADASARPAFEALLAAERAYRSNIYSMAEIPGWIAGVALLWVMASRRSPYPRWMLAAVPVWTFLALTLLTPAIPAPLGSILVGGAANLAFVVFFAALTACGPRVD